MSGKIASRFSFQRIKRLGGIFRVVAFQDDINRLGLWRPDAEVRLIRLDEFGANGVAASDESCRIVGSYGH
jgi:hypothetical protein